MSYKYSPPTGWPPANTRNEIQAEFKRWNDQAGERVVSDYDLPMARAGQVEAAVVFLLRGNKVTVKLDKWPDFGTNLRCCLLIIKDMRLGEARGMTEAIRSVYAQLPAPKTERDPHEVLGVRPDAPVEVAEAAYKAQAKLLHPDTSQQDGAAMVELNKAIEAVRAR